MKQSTIQRIIDEEIENVKWGKTQLNEELEAADIRELRAIVRKEVSAIFFELFKKRKTWGA
jgi:hypothetical protein